MAMKKGSDVNGEGQESGSGPVKPGLSRQLIVRTALGIVDRDGLAALSMRRLGAELKVDPMAVYYHIRNKAALLNALVEVVMGEIDLAQDDPSLPVDKRLFRAFAIYRDTLLAHPRALPVVSSRRLNTPVALKPADFAVGVFREAGFSSSEALAAVNIIAAYVRGSATIAANHAIDSELHEYEQMNPEELTKEMPEDRFPNLWACLREGCVQGFEGEFELGLKALIRGLLDTHKDKKSFNETNSK